MTQFRLCEYCGNILVFDGLTSEGKEEWTHVDELPIIEECPIN